jgi:hypothetical protein
MREQFDFFAEASHFFGETFFKGCGLFETTPLKHGAAPFHARKAGAQRAFSSPIKATVRAVMVPNVSATEGLLKDAKHRPTI